MDKVKSLGQVWTPVSIVDLILDSVSYSGSKILQSKVLEPSFGAGVFIFRIIDRLVKEGLAAGLSSAEVSEVIDDNLYGVEIDEETFDDTYAKVISYAAEKYNLTIKLPNLVCSDTLDYSPSQVFDFIVGNPPYVRVHNLPQDVREKIKRYSHSTGTTDLYIIFYEICLGWLALSGKLGFIAPNSWLRNTSQKNFRDSLLEQRRLERIINFVAVDVFPGIATYTCITVLSGSKVTNVDYAEMESLSVEKFSVRKELDSLAKGQPLNFVSTADESFVSRVSSADPDCNSIGNVSKVQNGIATLGDKLFLIAGDNPLRDAAAPYVRPVVKGSRYKGGSVETYMLFPYAVQDGKVVGVSESDLTEPLRQYFSSIKPELLKRSLDKNADWFWYGRSQSLQETFKRKLVISPVVNPKAEKISTYIVPAGTLVYSGLFVTETDSKTTLETVKDKLESEDFLKYASLVGKDMNGGYKNINTKIVKNFLL